MERHSPVQLIWTHSFLWYTVPFPQTVGATSRSRSYRKQELAPTEDRMDKMEFPDVKRKNAFVLNNFI